jgi:uncharacterized protein
MSSKMYPSQQEQVVIGAAEKLMTETMARYDPSHDVYHGIPGICDIYFDGSLICSSLKKKVNRVRKTALSLARALSSPVDLFVTLE